MDLLGTLSLEMAECLLDSYGLWVTKQVQVVPRRTESGLEHHTGTT
jgi:hypothetical protein